MGASAIELRLPAWAVEHMRGARAATDAERMRYVVELASENVRRRTGGPFGAAVFESGTGDLVSVGVNLVTSLRQSMLHAEVVAIMMAQQRVGTWTLGASGQPRHELVTSCEPCAMCLGAVLWSGVHRLVCGAAREDAEAAGFDEGPVYAASYEYLESRGIEVVRRVERALAREVFAKYAADDGVIYNA
jgi:tRNA(Arg) A34 adenosine deaminase TadA